MSKDNDKNALVPMREIMGEFRQYYERTIKAEYQDLTVREERLRVSGFPYCGLEHAYKRLTKDDRPRLTTLGAQYYTGVGTITHSLVQEWIGRGGQMLGSWKCLQEGCGGFREISRKSTCPKCGAYMLYEELTVKAFKHVSGHLDGIYKAANGEYFLIDYKTSSVRVIKSQHENRTLPYRGNVWQISAYCALIELIFDIKISGWILFYIARDEPLRTYRPEGRRITEKQKNRILKRIKGFDRHYDMVLKMKKFPDLMQLVEEKPCKDYDYYKKEFDGFDPCPLSKGGLCFQPKKLKEFLRITWDDRPRTVNNK